MNNITIVFCEGMHDINFLSKILYAYGYKDYKKKLKTFKEPLGKQYLNILSDEKDLKAKTIGFNSMYKIPAVALFKEDEELVLFHNMGGDGRVTERKKVLNMYKELQSEDDFTSSYNLNFKFLYFFDADTSPLEDRINKLNEELNLSENLKHIEILDIDSYQWGCYIFHKDKDGGYLEDILLALMKPANEEVFESAEKFISLNRLTPIKRESEYDPFNDEYKNKCKFKDKKSLISVAGQLQFSGMANAVIIAKSDYIKRDDILNSDVCNDIMKLFIK
ncbi:MAG: hypothetical protein QM493_02675 [Sulfurovum sp.]